MLCWKNKQQLSKRGHRTLDFINSLVVRGREPVLKEQGHKKIKNNTKENPLVELPIRQLKTSQKYKIFKSNSSL